MRLWHCARDELEESRVELRHYLGMAACENGGKTLEMLTCPYGWLAQVAVKPAGKKMLTEAKQVDMVQAG